MGEKNVIITGASSGIGRATALRLAACGQRLFLLARRGERLRELVEEIAAAGGRAEGCVADVTDGDRLRDIAATVAGDHGGIDVLINNAGIMPAAHVVSLDLRAAHECIDVNLKGVINAVHAVLPHMVAQNRGHIINVSSVGADRILPGLSVYSAAKAGVAVFTEALRQEMAASYNIRVSELMPGAVATELAAGISDPDMLDQFSRFRDVRFLDPDDMARAVAFMIEQPDYVSINQLRVRPTNQEF